MQRELTEAPNGRWVAGSSAGLALNPEPLIPSVLVGDESGTVCDVQIILFVPC